MNVIIKQLLERGRELAMPSVSARAEGAVRLASSGSGRVVHAPKPGTAPPPSPPILLPFQPPHLSQMSGRQWEVHGFHHRKVHLDTKL